MSKVIVVGSINMDVVGIAPRHPRPGETILGSELHLLPGGKGANQAVAARRASAATLMVGRVGSDVFADPLEDFLREENVDLTYVKRGEAAPTGTALITVAGGENTIVVVPGANAELAACDVESVPFDTGDVIVAQFEVPQATIAAAFALGKRAGGTTVLNAAPAAPCEPKLLQLTDVLVVNETELCELLGGSDTPDDMTADDALRGAAALRISDEQTVIVTLGAQGAVALAGQRELRASGRAVKAVDTTGAGDCFVGNLAAELSRQATLEYAVEAANLAASLCVQTLGAAVSMPHLDHDRLEAQSA